MPNVPLPNSAAPSINNLTEFLERCSKPHRQDRHRMDTQLIPEDFRQPLRTAWNELKLTVEVPPTGQTGPSTA